MDPGVAPPPLIGLGLGPHDAIMTANHCGTPLVGRHLDGSAGQIYPPTQGGLGVSQVGMIREGLPSGERGAASTHPHLKGGEHGWGQAGSHCRARLGVKAVRKGIEHAIDREKLGVRYVT